MKSGGPALGMRLRLWLETDAGVALGPGKIRLLELIAGLGSLNKASKAMHMSYRAAWGKIKAAEKNLGQALISRDLGRRGYQLTDLGIGLVEAYNKWRAQVRGFAQESAEQCFSRPVKVLGGAQDRYEDADE
ncbi:MAG: LysR family transcriptional regulator [Desulfovibrionaceae bacterium]|nr:LysR family transcriptional regulator [Desulfovibrionaceae bacterium]